MSKKDGDMLHSIANGMSDIAAKRIEDNADLDTLGKHATVQMTVPEYLRALAQDLRILADDGYDAALDYEARVFLHH